MLKDFIILSLSPILLENKIESYFTLSWESFCTMKSKLSVISITENSDFSKIEIRLEVITVQDLREVIMLIYTHEGGT